MILLGFYSLAGLLGAVVGMCEIVSRYRDAPGSALLTVSAWLYIGLNLSASLATLALVRSLEATGGASLSGATPLVQSLAAGISAMALLRTSLFTMRVGNADIAIGPAALLQVLLSAVDRATDRARAQPRANAVQQIMGGISFDLAKEALPNLCFGLMQGLTLDEQVTFGNNVKALASSTMEDAFKANSLGLSLMNLVGEDVLRVAVNMMRNDISAKPKPIVQSILTLTLLQGVNFATDKQTLIDGCLFVANRIGDAEMQRRLALVMTKLEALTVTDRRKGLFLASSLIAWFGEDTVQYVLKSLAEGRTGSAASSPANSTGNVVPMLPSENQAQAGGGAN